MTAASVCARIDFGPYVADTSSDDAVQTFADALVRTAHALPHPLVSDADDRLVVHLRTANPRALAPETYGPRLRSLLEAAETAVDRPAHFRLPTQHATSRPADPATLILYVEPAAAGVAPVRRGDTFSSVMLGLTSLSEDDRAAVTAWAARYAAADTLWLASAELSHAAYAQIADPDSPLMSEARGHCALIEAATGIPTFAYVHRHYGFEGEDDPDTRPPDQRGCPRCRRPWRTDRGANFHAFDYRCPWCRLVSNAAAETAVTDDERALAAVASGQL